MARMRTEYVIPLQGQLAARIDQLEGDKSKATSTSHGKKLQKEQDDLKKKQANPTEFELNAIRNDPVRLAAIRLRLSDLSWWMRLLCQYIAMRANGEDGKGLGRFWQGRYKAVRILDEESLLACAAYIDLNPIRADMAETLEQSDYTSVQRRVQAIMTTALDSDSSGEVPPEVERVALESATPPRADAFLAPVSIDERKDALGPHPSRNGRRSSDKGFLTMAEAEYLEILDWLVRDRVAGKRRATPLSAPPVLERLGIEPTLWSAMVKDFGRTFMNVAGTAKSVSEARSRKTHRKFYRARVYVGTRARGVIRKNSTIAGAKPPCCSRRDRFRIQT